MGIFSLAYPRANAVSVMVIAALTAAALAGCAAAAGSSAGPAGQPPLTCAPQTIPVTLAPHVAGRVTGQLCARGDPSGRLLQILVPGAGYGAYYWAFPDDPARYSYVQAATRAGYATLAINRPGTEPGTGYPPAADLTVPAEARALHAVIVAARRGVLHAAGRWPAGRIWFTTVLVAAHSLGSYIAIDEAATYGDADGLILTGATHRINLAGRAQVAASNHPAAADPKFRAAGLPAGYLTSKPPASVRAADFYAPPTTDPRVVQADEQLRTTTTPAELAGITAVAADAATSRRIRVPVLLAVGQDDKLSCGPAARHLSCATAQALLSRERPCYSAAASLSAYVVPGAGHDINLATDARQWFTVASEWIAGHFLEAR